MNGTGVGDEVLSRPWVAREKLSRQQVSLEAIARAARKHDVPGRVSTAVR